MRRARERRPIVDVFRRAGDGHGGRLRLRLRLRALGSRRWRRRFLHVSFNAEARADDDRGNQRVTDQRILRDACGGRRRNGRRRRIRRRNRRRGPRRCGGRDLHRRLIAPGQTIGRGRRRCRRDGRGSRGLAGRGAGQRPAPNIDRPAREVRLQPGIGDQRIDFLLDLDLRRRPVLGRQMFRHVHVVGGHQQPDRAGFARRMVAQQTKRAAAVLQHGHAVTLKNAAEDRGHFGGRHGAGAG